MNAWLSVCYGFCPRDIWLHLLTYLLSFVPYGRFFFTFDSQLFVATLVNSRTLPLGEPINENWRTCQISARRIIVRSLISLLCCEHPCPYSNKGFTLVNNNCPLVIYIYLGNYRSVHGGTSRNMSGLFAENHSRWNISPVYGKMRFDCVCCVLCKNYATCCINHGDIF